MNHNNKLVAALKLAGHGWKIPEAKGEVKAAIESLALDHDMTRHLCALIDATAFERCDHAHHLEERCLSATEEAIVIAAMTENRGQFDVIFELLHKYAELGGLVGHRTPEVIKSIAGAVGMEFLGLLYGEGDDSDVETELKKIIESKYGKPSPKKVMGVTIGHEVSNKTKGSIAEAFLSGEIFDVISGVTGAAPENEEWADFINAH